MIDDTNWEDIPNNDPDTLISFDEWKKFYEREFGKIPNINFKNIVGYTDKPVGIYNGKTFTVKTKSYNRLSELTNISKPIIVYCFRKDRVINTNLSKSILKRFSYAEVEV